MAKLIPEVIHTGMFHIGSLEIRCHVLDNGQRVIPEEDVIKFFDWLASNDEALDITELQDFAKFIKGVE